MADVTFRIKLMASQIVLIITLCGVVEGNKYSMCLRCKYERYLSLSRLINPNN